MAPSTATTLGLSNLQDHLSLVCNRPLPRNIPYLSKALRAQATNCVRFSKENNDLLEFLGDRLINLISALIVEEVKVDKCHHTVRLLELERVVSRLGSACSQVAIHNVGGSLSHM